MREYTQPDTYASAIKSLQERVDSLERAKSAPATPVYRVNVTATAFPSPPYRPPAPVTITDLWAEAATAVTDNTTFELQRNGTTVGSVTIQSGETTAMATIGPVTFDYWDLLRFVRS